MISFQVGTLFLDSIEGAKNRLDFFKLSHEALNFLSLGFDFLLKLGPFEYLVLNLIRNYPFLLP